MVLPPTNFVTKRKKEEKQGKDREKVIQREKGGAREEGETYFVAVGCPVYCRMC